MGTSNLSDYDPAGVPDARGLRFGIVVSDWNSDITGALLDGAVKTLRKHGVKKRDILVTRVPGSFELTAGARMMASEEKLNAVICLGCVIRGETPHFDFICQGVSYGITQLNIIYKIPIIFGVLTTLNIEQAAERAGGKLGNKGDEAAIAAIKMAALRVMSS